MTDLNNSNDDEERPNDASHGGGSPMDDLDAAWAEFADSHADDLKAVERSRSAKRFEKHAQRREKEALLSIDDLDQGTFTNDAPANGRGPRDFTGSSWLDTDRVMDRYGDDFVPPNPEIGHVKLSKLVFWILLVAGVIGEYGRPEERMICNYRRYAREFPLMGTVLRTMAAERLPALVHCEHGKDRTGMLLSLIHI